MSPPTTTCITRRRLIRIERRGGASAGGRRQGHGRRERGRRPTAHGHETASYHAASHVSNVPGDRDDPVIGMGPSPVCGISGIVSQTVSHASHDASHDEMAVRRMNDALQHRGPDAAGLWSRAGAVLGHRRLSIIDLTPEGTQPLLNEDETVGVVVNGEIYNFAELRAGLVERGHVFRSRSDSEVVLHLYEDHGADCVAKLTGMFAFALWDAKKGRLLLARDRAGGEEPALLLAPPRRRPRVRLGAARARSRVPRSSAHTGPRSDRRVPDPPVRAEPAHGLPRNLQAACRAQIGRAHV